MKSAIGDYEVKKQRVFQYHGFAYTKAGAYYKVWKSENACEKVKRHGGVVCCLSYRSVASVKNEIDNFLK